MKKKRIIIGVFFLFLSGIVIFRLIVLNQQYPSPQVSSYSLNEPVLYDGQFEVTVTDYYFLDAQTINRIFENEISMNYDLKCIILNVKVKNIGKTEKAAEIFPFVLQSSAWYNGINMGAFTQINKNSKPSSLQNTLAPGEEYEIKLPFSMIAQQFKPSSWNEVKNRKYSLIIALYPQKIIINL